jgi:putative ABC transport system permease protein
VLGLVLAAVGVYGLLAFTVSSRTNEIGVRMALGATQSRVLRLILGDAGLLLALGVGLGVPLAWMSARTASRLLFGHDPGALPIVSAIAPLTIVAVVAAWLPARRGSANRSYACAQTRLTVSPNALRRPLDKRVKIGENLPASSTRPG